MTVADAKERLLDLLEQLGGIAGVRGSLVATADGALAGGARSGLPSSVANDVAKTVRRMTVASSTVGVAMQELLINFGSQRMMVIPLSDDAAAVVLLERDKAVGPVRSLLSVEYAQLRELLDREPSGDELVDAPGDETLGEIQRIMQGPLGPSVTQITECFTHYVISAGIGRGDAAQMIDEQMREWLLCCNPSPYTLPLLVDGLGQLLEGAPEERGEFMNAVHAMVERAQSASDRPRS